jgi:hypothetical protein
MATVTGQLCVDGTHVGGIDVASEGRPVSECVVVAKTSIMALLNTHLAAQQGAAGTEAAAAGAGAGADGGEPDVYEDNVVDDGAAEEADAKLLGLSKSPPTKKHKHVVQA